MFMFAIVIISAIVDLSIIGLAQDDSDSSGDGEEEEEETEFDCGVDLSAALVELDAAFDEDLDTAVTSEEPGDVVVDAMIERYKEYVDAVEAAYDEAIAYTEGQTLTDVSERTAACEEELSDHFAMNESNMSTQVVSSSYGKKTTALLDEYKWINEKLAEMQERVSFIHSNIVKMTDMLPGFTKSCVKS